MKGAAWEVKDLFSVEEFAERACTVLGVDRGEVLETVRTGTSCLDSKVLKGYHLHMKQRWEDSLVAGKPDFSIYKEPRYFILMFICWTRYSSVHIREIRRPGSLFGGISVARYMSPRISSVLDLGCGIGYSTVALSGTFPHAKVTGTNVEGSDQLSICRSIKSEKVSFTADMVGGPDGADLIFASEYFEHIPDCFDHLEDLLLKKKPRFFLAANTFHTRDLGHLDSFSGRVAGRVGKREAESTFLMEMARHGYRVGEANFNEGGMGLWYR